MVSAPEKTTHQRMAEKHRGKWWRRRRWRSQRRRRIEHFPNRKLFEKFDNKPVFMGPRPARRFSISSSVVIPPTNILCVPLTSQPTERLLNDNHTTAESLLGSLVRWMRWKSFYLFGWLWRATFEGHVVEWGKLAWCVSLYPVSVVSSSVGGIYWMNTMHAKIRQEASNACGGEILDL